MRRRDQQEYETVVMLIDAGWGDSEIAHHTAVPRSTVKSWRRGQGTRFHERMRTAHPSWRPSNGESYCYLLGVYLGDGCVITRPGGSAALVITLDAAYDGIVEETTSAAARCFPDTPVRQYARHDGHCVAVQLNHPALPFAFPQHGPGRKHLRPIGLEFWQWELTHRFPRALLRGLIHSDGCRTVNRFKTRLPSGRVAAYEYPRYFFSNLSQDIRRIFCEHCELLGIRWTQSNPRNISISYRKSVALMDEFIGPKS